MKNELARVRRAPRAGASGPGPGFAAKNERAGRLCTCTSSSSNSAQSSKKIHASWMTGFKHTVPGSERRTPGRMRVGYAVYAGHCLPILVDQHPIGGGFRKRKAPGQHPEAVAALGRRALIWLSPKSPRPSAPNTRQVRASSSRKAAPSATMSDEAIHICPVCHFRRPLFEGASLGKVYTGSQYRVECGRPTT